MKSKLAASAAIALFAYAAPANAQLIDSTIDAALQDGAQPSIGALRCVGLWNSILTLDGEGRLGEPVGDAYQQQMRDFLELYISMTLNEEDISEDAMMQRLRVVFPMVTTGYVNRLNQNIEVHGDALRTDPVVASDLAFCTGVHKAL